jgi:hypothetical protein
MARFAELADAGFPNLSKVFDRYVDVLGELGVGYSYFASDEAGGRLVRAFRSDQVEREAKERGAKHLYITLRELARVLLPVYHLHLWGFLIAHES